MSSLAPQPRFRIVDADGIALVGGHVYTYAAGTSTPKDSYTDSTLGSANTNPVILDTRGEADIWLSGSYKIVVTDSLDVLLPDHTIDNVRDLTLDATFTNPTLAGAPVVTAATVTWSGNPTHSGNHTWSGTQTFNGNVVVGDAGTDTLTVAPNAVTWSNNPTHSGNHTFSGNVAVTGTQAFTGNTTLTTWAGTTSGSVKLSATGVPYGTSIHNNAGAVTGTTNQYICSGTYTPTLFNTTNVAASTSLGAQWIRVGNVVMVSGAVNIDPTAGTTATVLGISLPIASAIANLEELAGTAVRGDTGVLSVAAPVSGDFTNDRALLGFQNDADVASKTWYFTFTYRVL